MIGFAKKNDESTAQTQKEIVQNGEERLIQVAKPSEFKSEILENGLRSNGTLEKAEMYARSIESYGTEIQSLMREELIRIIVSGDREEAPGIIGWVGILGDTISYYKKEIGLVENMNVSTYVEMSKKTDILDAFIKDIRVVNKKVSSRGKKQYPFASKVLDMCEQMDTDMKELRGLWEGTTKTYEKLERDIEKLDHTFSKIRNIEGTMERAKASAGDVEDVYIISAKKETTRLAEEKAEAKARIIVVQKELDELFKPINDRVSRKYDHDTREHLINNVEYTLGGFLANNQSILEDFVPFLIKIEGLEQRLNPQNVRLHEKDAMQKVLSTPDWVKLNDDKARWKALISIQQIRGQVADWGKIMKAWETRNFGAVKELSESSMLIKKIREERMLAERISQIDEQVENIKKEISAFRTPALEQARRLEEIKGEHSGVHKRISDIKGAIVDFVKRNYNLKVVFRGSYITTEPTEEFKGDLRS